MPLRPHQAMGTSAPARPQQAPKGKPGYEQTLTFCCCSLIDSLGGIGWS